MELTCEGMAVKRRIDFVQSDLMNFETTDKVVFKPQERRLELYKRGELLEAFTNSSPEMTALVCRLLSAVTRNRDFHHDEASSSDHQNVYRSLELPQITDDHIVGGHLS
jgi:hypothetical protein